MIRSVLPAALVVLLGAAAAPMAGAQTGNSASGGVGGTALRNGYPATGGAITLPALANATESAAAVASPTGAAAPGRTAASVGAAGGSSGSGSGSGGSTSAPTGGGGARSARTGGGGENWVLCPPAGSSGLLPLFAGTDLSCAPD